MGSFSKQQRFIDRSRELQTLEKEYSSPNPSFVVIYGRRRIGKSTLINEFLKRYEDSVSFLATEVNIPRHEHHQSTL